MLEAPVKQLINEKLRGKTVNLKKRKILNMNGLIQDLGKTCGTSQNFWKKYLPWGHDAKNQLWDKGCPMCCHTILPEKLGQENIHYSVFAVPEISIISIRN